jgi:hypothetical protein
VKEVLEDLLKEHMRTLMAQGLDERDVAELPLVKRAMDALRGTDDLPF